MLLAPDDLVWGRGGISETLDGVPAKEGTRDRSNLAGMKWCQVARVSGPCSCGRRDHRNGLLVQVLGQVEGATVGTGPAAQDTGEGLFTHSSRSNYEIPRKQNVGSDTFIPTAVGGASVSTASDQPAGGCTPNCLSPPIRAGRNEPGPAGVRPDNRQGGDGRGSR